MPSPSRPIMIVEDDPYIMSAIVEILQMNGRELIVATNGLEAVQKLKVLRPYEYPCCIILDLMMPVMSGEEFIFQIQAMGRVELDSIPIIVSSANNRLKDLDSQRIKNKMNKPIDISFLEEIAETYV